MKPFPFFVVPSPLGLMLSKLPAYPGSMLLATAVDAALTPHLPQDVLQGLLNRRMRIHVRDAHLNFDLMWNGRRFTACPPHQDTELTITANTYDFLQLAQRKEAAEALFFDRRLSMEGDAEFGLLVKNALDRLDIPVFDWKHWTPRQVLARVAPRRASGPGPFGGKNHS